jgi:hypothetical protein
MTQDVDLLVRDTEKNREKIRMLGQLLGAGQPIARTPLANVLTLVGSAVPIDIVFDSLSGGLSFESVRSRSVTISLGDRAAVVASLEDIIASKRPLGGQKISRCCRSCATHSESEMRYATPAIETDYAPCERTTAMTSSSLKMWCAFLATARMASTRTLVGSMPRCFSQ